MITDAITQPEPHVADTHGPDYDDCGLCQTAKVATLKTRLITAREFAGQAEFAYGEKYKDLIAQQDVIRARWEHAHALLVAEYNRTRDYLETTEKELREAVVDWCREHDTKKFDEHLSMRVAIKLNYEPSDATAWAKANAPFILVADKKEFDAIAKKQELDFVTKVPAYSAVIATDLTSEAAK